MKRMTKKLYGILILSMLATSAHAGWLSNLGQRIVNGAANTVQNNISGKVNKTIDDVMDGKLKQNSKKGDFQADVSANQGSTQVNNQNESISKATTGGTRYELYSGSDYELVDLGTMQFKGKKIYNKSLMPGQEYLEVNELLHPGYYLIWISAISYQQGIDVMYKNERAGVTFGYGLNVKQEIENGGNYDMRAGKKGLMYVIEVKPNTTGTVELFIFPHAPEAHGQISIFKIPGPTLK